MTHIHTHCYPHNQSIIQGLRAVFDAHFCQARLRRGKKQVRTQTLIVAKRLEREVQTSKSSLIFSV